MQLGSMIKWVDLLKSGKYKKAISANLKWESNGVMHYNALGVLGELVNENNYEYNSFSNYIHNGVKKYYSINDGYYTIFGEAYYLPTDTLKKCKIKNREFNFIDDNGILNSFAEIDVFAKTFDELVPIIEKYYSQF